MMFAIARSMAMATRRRHGYGPYHLHGWPRPWGVYSTVPPSCRHRCGGVSPLAVKNLSHLGGPLNCLLMGIQVINHIWGVGVKPPSLQRNSTTARGKPPAGPKPPPRTTISGVSPPHGEFASLYAFCKSSKESLLYMCALYDSWQAGRGDV
jgi:hypothetical protein